VVGFLSGVGKGLAGLVFKPLGATVDLVVKTGEGIINTPKTIAEAAKSTIGPIGPTKHFGIPLLDSIEKAKKSKQNHVFVNLIKYFESQKLEAFQQFLKPCNVEQVSEWKNMIDKVKLVTLPPSPSPSPPPRTPHQLTAFNPKGQDLLFEGFAMNDVSGLFKVCQTCLVAFAFSIHLPIISL